MIAPNVVKEVRRLLAEGKLSQREIARINRISRGTVGAIASGKRPDHENQRPAGDEEGLPGPDGPPRRCPDCGVMVYLPCRACQIRRQKASSSKPPLPRRLTPLDEPLGLDLTGQYRERYEQIRLQRLSAESESDPPEPYDPTEFDDEECELDPAAVWDAFELDDEEPAIIEAWRAELDDLGSLDYDELLLPDST